MAKSGKILKIIGGAALIYWAASAVSSKITGNLRYGFKSLRFINFWENIVKLKIELETIMTIENLNTVVIEVESFKGHLTYREEKIAQLIQDIPVVLKPKTRQPIRFVFKSNLLAAAAKLYLAFTGDIKRIEGSRIKGDLYVAMEGIPFIFPYDEAVTIDL